MTARRLADLLPPLAFGFAVLALWEAGVRLLHVPEIILPPPSAIATRFLTSIPTLSADFWQTIKGVLAGYVIGSLSGLVVAILVDRSQFLQRGLLPLGNLVSALPIVGIAPIMVMWFGFDWQSKAAVVVVMTFFPITVGMVKGFRSPDPLQLDLMRTYSATGLQTFLKLRAPASAPFFFASMKIGAAAALVGAVVAEVTKSEDGGLGARLLAGSYYGQTVQIWAALFAAAALSAALVGIIGLLGRFAGHRMGMAR